MAPLIVEVERRGWAMNLVFTGQHRETMQVLMQQFCIRTQPKYVYEGDEISGIAQMGRWFARSLISLWRQRAYFFPNATAGRHGVLVHGDTASTLLGAVIGRWIGLDVVHIEAGLRSRNLFHPFPEEMIRLLVSRLATLAFCPGEWAVRNLVGLPLQKINTGQNTLLDAVRLASLAPRLQLPGLPCSLADQDYGVVSLHRFENIFRYERFAQILRLLEYAAISTPLIFVLHPSTRKKLEQYGLMHPLTRNPRITLVPRMGYFEFIQLVSSARFVISDGGGNQEELAYMGVPTLLMRKATERQEGLGVNAVLCPYDLAVLQSFLDRLPQNRQGAVLQEGAPSLLIADHLSGYAA